MASNHPLWESKFEEILPAIELGEFDGFIVVAGADPLGYYDTDRKEFVVTHPNRVVAIEAEEINGP